jgi:hypothetical protein
VGVNARELVINIAVSLVCELDYGKVWCGICCNSYSPHHRCVAMGEKTANGLSIMGLKGFCKAACLQSLFYWTMLNDYVDILNENIHTNSLERVFHKILATFS